MLRIQLLCTLRNTCWFPSFSRLPFWSCVLVSHCGFSLHLPDHWQRVFLPTPPSNSSTSAVFPAVPLNYDTTYLETASDSTGQGLSLTRPSLSPFRCQSQVQVVTCASDQLAVNWRFPWPTSLGLINLLEWLTELRETFTYVISWL